MKRVSKEEQKQLRLREEYRNKTGIIFADMDYMSLSGRDKALICLVKGILIFLNVYGMNMLFITSLDLPCSIPLVGIFSLGLSMFAAFFYYRKLFFNLGYILFFVIFLAFSVGLLMLANSGMNAIVNLIMEAVDDKLNLGGVRVYQEVYTNRYITITCCLILLLFFYISVLNSLISEYMSGIAVFILTYPAVQICLYVDDTVNYLWVTIMMIPVVLCMILRHSYKFKLTLNAKPLGFRFKKKGKKEITLENRTMQKQNVSLLVYGLIALTFLFIITFSVIKLIPYRYRNNHSEMKSSTDEAVAEFALHGISGYFNSYQATAGISNGRLGGVREVTMDFETDLILDYVPFSTDPLYLRAFVGSRYYKNQWIALQNYSVLKASPYNFSNTSSLITMESDYLKLLYQYRFSGSAAAKIRIMNVTNQMSSLYPYYTDYTPVIENSYRNTNPRYIKSYMSQDITRDYYTDILERNHIQELTFYPLLYTEIAQYANRTDEIAEKYRLFVYENYLDVPKDQRDVLHEICESQNFGGEDPLTVVTQIQNYFRNNYTYTRSPGKTPRNRDFVTYFLTKQKKGYCVHFASAGVMLLRYMGFPARYVEGYCVDIATVADADPVSYDTDWHDWYDGDDRLSLQENDAKVLSVEVNDSKAHAWVEVFLDGFGWYPVELTTGWQESSEDDEDFWSQFANYMAGDEDGSPLLAITSQARKIGFGLAYAAGIAVLIVVFIFIIRRLIRVYSLYMVRSNKRLSNQFVFLNRLLRKYAITESGNVFHLQAVEIGNSFGMDYNELTEYASLVEEASYGRRKLTSAELKTATKTFRNYLRKIRSRLKGLSKIRFQLFH